MWLLRSINNMSSQRRLFVLSLTSTILLVSFMIFLFYLGNKLIKAQSSKIEAAKEIKYKATNAHLWFEEIMSGDRGESIDDVWRDIDQADWYAGVLLDGGDNNVRKFYPLKDPVLRKDITSVRKALTRFEEIARKRYQNFSDSNPGTEIDIKFDTVFHEFIQLATSVETKLHRQVDIELSFYQKLSFFVIGVSTLLSFLLSRFLYRREALRSNLLTSLTDAQISIEEKNKKLYELAHYDFLTGLANRNLFIKRMDTALVQTMKGNGSVALLFIDLDHFKIINDQHGHHIGDRLLQQVAGRLLETVKDRESVYRLSGDEFVVLLNNFSALESSLLAAEQVAAELVGVLQNPYQLNGPVVFITASIGISVYPEDGINTEQLLTAADQAMYSAKSSGKNHFQFYSKELSRLIKLQAEVESDLRVAIQDDQFELHFQPQWQLATGKISGVEVLVRWRHPERGLLFPIDFIPVAESSGLIKKLDFLILRKAINQLEAWQNGNFDVGILAINISPVCFCQSDFLEKIRHYMKQTCIQANNVELELTESVLVENNQHSQMAIRELKQLGIRVAIDDFGTGYTSMSYLRDFSVDTLKIDRSFVAEIDTSKTSQIILKNMISLGVDLGLKVVAEGVETKAQEKFLTAQNCHTAQGYLLSKPLNSEALETFILSKKADNIISI